MGLMYSQASILPPIMPPRKNQISLALRGRIGTIRPDRIATTGTAERADHSGFPTGGGTCGL